MKNSAYHLLNMVPKIFTYCGKTYFRAVKIELAFIAYKKISSQHSF